MNQHHNTITRQETLDFLSQHRLATLATVKEGGLPDAASVYYMVKDSCELIFLTREKTGKFQNIQKSNEVVLVVTDREKLETVKIRGKAFPMPGDFEAIQEVVDHFSDSKEFVADLDKVLPILKRGDEGAVVAVRIEPYRASMSKYSTEVLEEKIFFCDNFRHEAA